MDRVIDASTISFRTWPHDLDTSLHMNNGRYWALMDLGRLDLLLRTGLWTHILRRRWVPIAKAGKIRFRRELKLFQKFKIQTKIVYWNDNSAVIEQRVLTSTEQVAAIALLLVGLYDRKQKRFIEIPQLMHLVGRAEESPSLSPEVQAFLQAEDSLKRATVSATP